MNLKQAAARLGVHYQTAYKLIRSGALSAIRVGGTYEISEAALGRYQAERAALLTDRGGRSPSRPGSHTAVRGTDALAEAVLAVGTVTLSARGAYDTITRCLAETMGDACVLRLITSDGQLLEPVSHHHPDSRARSIVAAVVEGLPQRTDEGFSGRVLSSGEGVFLPHVPQDLLRAGTKPEFLQYLDEIGIHSMMLVPVREGGEVLGTLGISRDEPGRPYTRDDNSLLVEMGRLAGVAARRAARFRAGWDRLGALVRAAGEVLAPGPDDLAALDALLADDDMLEIICDPAGRVVAANAAAEAFAGIAAGRLAGRDLLDLVVPREQPDERAIVDRLVSGDLAFVDGERTAVSATGDVVRLVVHRGVVRTPDAVPRAVLLVADRAITVGRRPDTLRLVDDDDRPPPGPYTHAQPGADLRRRTAPSNRTITPLRTPTNLARVTGP